MTRLTDVWDREILPVMGELEAERLQLLDRHRRYLLMGLGLVVAVFGLSALGVPFAVVLIPALVIGVYLLWRDRRANAVFVNHYKTRALAALLKAIDPSLRIQPKSHVPEKTVERARFFLGGFDYFSGEDLITGTIGETRIYFSEVLAQRRSKRRRSSGARVTQKTTVFNGVVFVADFNKQFRSRTVLVPDVAEATFGGLGRFFQRLNLVRGNLIQMENPELEEYFAVYGDDETEARYLLTPDFMSRLVEFRTRAGPMRMSFVDESMMMAIPVARNLLEPSLGRSLLDPETFRTHWDDMNFFVGIVGDLDLNTRIWTKE